MTITVLTASSKTISELLAHSDKIKLVRSRGVKQYFELELHNTSSNKVYYDTTGTATTSSSYVDVGGKISFMIPYLGQVNLIAATADSVVAINSL